MPNQRKKGKKMVAVWLDEDELLVLRKLSKIRKVPMSEILKTEIERGK
jgi:hypothetical protein